ncbi:anthrax toxin-like adenylyl cyclase domain-containing protein [Salidesulfovibrio brasiliensis]|uniref:anthrax toxin-like adenylyl cyclase domain-containing protein n=1 Tax=Salidesulfovibrio brasiliensis TaxID=221711 RepID=UPI0006CF466E|nr:anthrax toxin-like adenylyl cyclase domain-containing protein [Salidesulfovibrio brasiliensis]
MRYLVSVFICLLLAFPAHAAQQMKKVDAPTADALLKRSESLSLELKELLKAIVSLRSAELKKMHDEVLKDVEAWENDELELDGKGLKNLLTEAYRVAEARNLPVTELQALFEQAKKMILRADYASLCGGGEDMESTLTNMAKSAEEAVTGESADHFFLVSDRVEGRMQCEQKHRLESFKGAYRHFIRALLAPTPSEAMTQMREFAGLIQHLNQAESNALVADADRLTNELGKTDMIIKMVPGVGDAFDAWDLYEQTNIAGEKLTLLDNAFTVVGLFYPKAFGMAIGYAAKGSVWAGKQLLKTSGKSAVLAGKGLSKTIAFFWKLATANSDTIAKMGKATGKNVKALQQQAVAGLTWLKGRYPKLADEGAQLAQASAQSVRSYADMVRNRVGGDTVVTSSTDDIVQASGRPAEWVDGFSRASQDSGSVIFTRSFNGEASPLYAKGMAEPKPIFVKSKSSREPLLMGTIPKEGRLSKAGDSIALERLTDSVRNELIKRGQDPSGASKIASKRLKKLIKQADATASKCIRDGYCKSVEFRNPNGNLVVKAKGAKGEATLYEQLPDGRLRDANGNFADPASFTKIKPVKVLADPHTGRYFGPDEDILAMGHQSGSSGTKHSDAIAGTYNSKNKAVMHLTNVYIRLKTKLLGHKPYSTSTHGAAQFFDMELESNGFMAYFPDGTKMLIGSKADLHAVFNMAREEGFQGLEWNPSW